MEKRSVRFQDELGKETIRGASDSQPFPAAIEVDPRCCLVGRHGVEGNEKILRAQVLVEKLPLFLIPGSLEHLLIAQGREQERNTFPFQILESRDGRRLMASKEADQD